MLNDKEQMRLDELKRFQAVFHKAGQFDTAWDKEIEALEAKAKSKPKPKKSAGDDLEVKPNGT